MLVIIILVTLLNLYAVFVLSSSIVKVIQSKIKISTFDLILGIIMLVVNIFCVICNVSWML
jgi:hypothetical protein